MKLLVAIMISFSGLVYAESQLNGQNMDSKTRFCDEVDQSCNACVRNCVMRGDDSFRRSKDVNAAAKKSLSNKKEARSE